MVRVKYDDLLLAYEFVSSSAELETAAYISLDTGEIYWKTEALDEKELPANLDASDRYLPVAHKSDLDLGTSLVFRFIQQELPHRYDDIRTIFRHKGAYHRFKQVLASEEALDKWFAFEAKSIETALREWCAEHGISVEERDDE